MKTKPRNIDSAVAKWRSVARRAGAVLGAGWLLQAGACSLDPSGITQGVAISIANNLIADVIFGLFNIPLTGGF